MFPQSFFPNSMFASNFWPKVGATGAIPPPTGGNRQYLPIMGIGAFLLFAVFLAGAAHGHGDADWIQQGHYTAENGTHCCGEADCHRITDERLVKRLRDGWEFKGAFFADTQHGKGLYATEKEDPFYCEFGGAVRCLFITPEGA